MKQFLTPVLYIVLGLIIGYAVAQVDIGLYLSNGLHDPFPPSSCVYNGVTYKDGEGFMDADGCNSCSCSGGVVGCTLMYCEPNDMEVDGVTR